MLENADTINPSVLLRPYGKAERALGELAFALRATPLHTTWLWRELTRISVVIAQIHGHRVRVSQLRLALIGAPLERDHNTSGLAAAKRVFLAAEPLLLQSLPKTDSTWTLLPAFWHDEDTEQVLDDSEATTGSDRAGEVARPQQVAWSQREAGPLQGARKQLQDLVRDLVGFADDGKRPALINLLADLKKHAAGPAAKRLPAPLVRIALPLALHEAGLVPKTAPGLLGGVRLPLGMSPALTLDQPLAEWLKAALEALADEADLSRRRLLELGRQHQAWHQALAKEGLRRHAKAPRALDLLTATPVLSIGLVARHLGCSHVAAGQIISRLADLGILIEQTSRSRHKVFVAGDLPAPAQHDEFGDEPLVRSEPAPLLDVDAVIATLDGLFADLDRLSQRAKDRTRMDGGVATARD